jgi:cell division protein FtsA
MFEKPQYSAPIGLIRYAQILDQEKPVRSLFPLFKRKVADFLAPS